jgi:hypothetical protein
MMARVGGDGGEAEDLEEAGEAVRQFTVNAVENGVDQDFTWENGRRIRAQIVTLPPSAARVAA